MNLYELAKLILLVEDHPISKVRFAKTIYFVHKGLIQRNILQSGDLSYMRMPLGPVPFGFMSIAQGYSDIITTSAPSGLSYNSTLYSLRPGIKKIFERNALIFAIEEILAGLKKVSTSELIEISHEDPSWKNHPNGTVYSITLNDLKKPVPQKGSGNRLDSDEQLIQASLVKGMIDDIVNESTDLEYPVNEQ